MKEVGGGFVAEGDAGPAVELALDPCQVSGAGADSASAWWPRPDGQSQPGPVRRRSIAASGPVTGVVMRGSTAPGQRYERAAPGDLVHADVKRRGRVPCCGGCRA